MMRAAHPHSDIRVVIAGVGMTPVREHWDRSLRELALDAIAEARQDAGGLRPQALYLANMYAPALSGQTHLATLIADYAGLRGIEAVSVEAAGASGGAALRQAYLAIKSGELDAALVVGVEKVTDRVGSAVIAAASASTDAEYESVQGVTQAAQAAMLMRRYLHEYGLPADALAGVSLTAHRNAVANPLAMFRKELKPEQYSKAPVISEPLTIFDAAPMADGAAAILLTRADLLPADPDRPQVRIAGSAAASGALALHDQPSPLDFPTVAQAARMAFARAGIGPQQVDFAELHDQFSIHAAMALEASGFARKGEGWKLAGRSNGSAGGELPILTFGGSKARGDVGGATGVYQAAEAALQLWGRAGGNQIASPRFGLVESIGGHGSTCVVHILEAEITDQGDSDSS